MIQTVAMALLLPIALIVCREQQSPALRERDGQDFNTPRWGREILTWQDGRASRRGDSGCGAEGHKAVRDGHGLVPRTSWL